MIPMSALTSLGSVAFCVPYKMATVSIPLVGACISVTMLQLRMRQRRRMLDQRLAGSLVAALRHGALDFEPAPLGSRRLILGPDPGDMEETQLALMPSHYQLLGHPGRLTVSVPKELPAPDSIAGMRLLAPPASSPDENLSARVPRPLTQPMQSTRSHRCDSRSTKKTLTVPAHFYATAGMAGLQVAPSSRVVWLHCPLAAPAAVVPVPGNAQPQVEPFVFNASALQQSSTSLRELMQTLPVEALVPVAANLARPAEAKRQVESLHFTAPALQQSSSSLRELMRTLPVEALVPVATEFARPAKAERQVEPFHFTPPTRVPHMLAI